MVNGTVEAMVGGPKLSADVVATVLGGFAFLQLGITRTLGGGDIVFDGDATHLSQGVWDTGPAS